MNVARDRPRSPCKWGTWITPKLLVMILMAGGNVPAFYRCAQRGFICLQSICSTSVHADLICICKSLVSYENSPIPVSTIEGWLGRSLQQEAPMTRCALMEPLELE